LLSAFPSGQLSEIAGPWSSGAGSLLLALIARITAAGHQAALIDAADAFDPVTAAEAGADLGGLVWVKCGGQPRTAWSAADLLIRCPGFALIALDLADPLLSRRERIAPAHYRRLKLAAEHSAAILVLRVLQPTVGNVAALAVSLRRLQTHWIGRPRATRLIGFTSEARIVRSRVHPSSRDEQVIRWPL